MSDDRVSATCRGRRRRNNNTHKSHGITRKQTAACLLETSRLQWESMLGFGVLRSGGGRCRIPRREMEHRRSDHKSLETPRLPSCHNGKISTSPLLSQSPSTLIPTPRCSSHSICTTTAAQSIHKSVRTWNTNQLFLV